MGRFFRENIIGILLISFLGSVLASVVVSYLGPQEPKSSNALVDLMKQPVPALALLPYSLAILLAFAAYAYWQNKKHARELVRLKTEGDREAADLRTEKDTLSARIQELEHHTSGTGTLMRRIALVLADPASPFQDSTLETVLKRVVSMEGNIASEREVADAMGIMLEARAIYKSGTKFELTNDWRARLRELQFEV